MSISCCISGILRSLNKFDTSRRHIQGACDSALYHMFESAVKIPGNQQDVQIPVFVDSSRANGSRCESGKLLSLFIVSSLGFTRVANAAANASQIRHNSSV